MTDEELKDAVRLSGPIHALDSAVERLKEIIQRERIAAGEAVNDARKFQLGDRVTKTKGSSWTGLVVGFYSTSLTPIGYAVESENEPGSVQIYPESALTTKEQGA